MVSVQISSENAPDIGKGRWTWPKHLLKDKKLKSYICKRGNKLASDITFLQDNPNLRSMNFNAQTLWKAFKTDIQAKAREQAKIVIPQLVMQIRELETKLDDILNDENLSEDNRIISAAVLTEKITQLEKQRHKSMQEATKVRNRLEGEIIGAYWWQLNKPSKPRDIIHRLQKQHRDDDEPEYEKDSQKMAQLARDYHEDLQSQGRHPDPDKREEKMQQVLQNISVKLTDSKAEELELPLSEDTHWNSLQTTKRQD